MAAFGKLICEPRGLPKRLGWKAVLGYREVSVEYVSVLLRSA